MEKQHVQLPNNMAEDGLTPKDQLIYLSIRRFMNRKTNIAFPSLQKISEVSGASINTIRKSIRLLEDKGYITVIKSGKMQKYYFNELKAFEPFSYDFLDKKDLTFTEKAYLVASQQYMFTDVNNYGKISYSNKELSNKINMPESTISLTNRSLVKKNYLTLIKNESKDLETGCFTDTKLFHLTELGQAVIWALQNHEERISQNTDDIQKLTEKLEKQEKIITSLLKTFEQNGFDYTL